MITNLRSNAIRGIAAAGVSVLLVAGAAFGASALHGPTGTSLDATSAAATSTSAESTSTSTSVSATETTETTETSETTEATETTQAATTSTSETSSSATSEAKPVTSATETTETTESSESTGSGDQEHAQGTPEPAQGPIDGNGGQAGHHGNDASPSPTAKAGD